MRENIKRFVAALGLVATALPAGAYLTKEKARFELLSEREEVALAKSAGLAPWNEEASVYVMTADGYVKAKQGTNGFTCMVGRDYPGTRWPICFDPVGTEAILPRYLREAEMRLQGKSEEEVRRDTAARFLSGEYHAPSRTGIAYMLSRDSITSNGRILIEAPPHLMIYAPNVQPSDVGAVPGHEHSPMILYPGDPHAYIIVFVPDHAPELRPVTEDESAKLR